MGRPEEKGDKTSSRTASDHSLDDDEESLRAKLRESGWTRQKSDVTNEEEKNEKKATSNSSSKEDREHRSEKRGGSRERDRSSRRNYRNDRKRSRRSRSRSPGRSRSRSRSRSRRDRKKSSRKSSRRSISRSGSKSPSRQDKDKDKKSSSKPTEENEEPTTNTDTDKKTHEKKSSRRSRSQSASEGRHNSRRRRNSRRSRSRSRSRSGGRRNRRSYSRSPSRSRGRRDRDHRRSHRSRRYSRSKSRSSSRRRDRLSKTKESQPGRRAADSSPGPNDGPPSSITEAAAATAAASGGSMASLNSSITQLMQQYPTLSLQEIIAKMQSSNLVIPTSSALKTARELYVGNLPPNVTATQLQEFLGTIIQQVGLAIQPGNPILSTWISTDGHFAFCEMRSVEECNMALLMNQLPLLGQPLKFGRPKGFAGPPQPMPIVSSRTQTALVNLGCTPNPAMFGAPGTVATTMGTDLSAFLGSTASGSNTTSNRLVMMNIPVVLEEEQVKELAEPFGTLKSFSLVKDPITGKSSGNALFEYEDAQIAEEAIKGLHNLDVGGIHLVVQRAPEGPGVSSTAANEEQPSVAVKMSNMVSAAELEDDEEYNDLKEDVEEECKRFGTVVSMIIPRPKDGAKDGIGSIFVRFQQVSEAAAAIKALKGRKFGGNVVDVTSFPIDKFERKDFA